MQLSRYVVNMIQAEKIKFEKQIRSRYQAKANFVYYNYNRIFESVKKQIAISELKHPFATLKAELRPFMVSSCMGNV